MSDANRPGDVPPDLPPEYAEAYRRGYERAYGNSSRAPDPPRSGLPEQAPDQPSEEAPERTAVTGPLFADEARHAAEPGTEPTQTLDAFDRSLLTQPPEGGEDPAAFHRGPAERPAWFVPAILGGLVLLLLLGAFAIGKVFSSSVSGHSSADQSPDGVVMGADGGTSTGGPTHQPKGEKYTGPTQAVAVGGASATCQAPSGVDAAGHQVHYSATNVYDGDMTTAWRCDGDGIGQKLTLQLPAGTRIGEVGLVPGYAKTDPRSGANRYAENNRVTKVRWIFDGGVAVEQTLDGSAHNRSLQSMRLPLVRTGKVVVQILSTTPGPRHTTAISEVRIGRPT